MFVCLFVYLCIIYYRMLELEVRLEQERKTVAQQREELGFFEQQVGTLLLSKFVWCIVVSLMCRMTLKGLSEWVGCIELFTSARQQLFRQFSSNAQNLCKDEGHLTIMFHLILQNI